MEENATTGYEWMYTDAHDCDSLLQVTSIFESTSSDMEGTASTRSYELLWNEDSYGAGTCTFSVMYAQSWNMDNPDTTIEI